MTTPVAPQQQNGVKRKSSTAGLGGSSRPVKRRASKACHCCRSRKVRCDVVESGIPCTNCRLDEVECVVTEGKRRKKSYIDGEVLHHSPIESIEEREEIPQFHIFDDIDGLQDLPVPGQSTNVQAQKPNNADLDLSHHRPHLIYQTQGHRLTPEERTRRISALGQRPPRLPTHPSIQYTQHVPFYPSPGSRPEVVLPQYIASIPKRMLSEDLEYLSKKGVFYIPETSVRNEMLRSYVQYVHPYLPLLDLQEFLTAIVEKKGTNGDISLLLFQAVMFAATAYIDMRFLTAMGYSSRKSARKAFFQRVKLLYDFDWEIDRVTVVQSVLLMTYWYESPNDPKDVWHWLGIAISIARTIGLNYGTEGSLLSPQKQKLWKRIWWSCYMRDRLVAIGMRRPIRIKKDDFDVPMLTVDDFETSPLPPDLCRMLGGCSAVRDESKRATLARMCVAVTEVCQLITDVLAVQYSVLGHKIGITSETTARLVPKKSGAEPSEVIKCDHKLEGWYKGLPLELRSFLPGTQERTNSHDGEVISVHRALLTGIYLTTTSALHRPQMMPVSPGLIIAPELKELSKRRVRDAAMDVTEIFRDLYAHDLVRYMPNTGVTVILPAIIIHLLDIKSTEAADRQTSMRHFQFCMQALQKMRDMYSSADFAFSFLDAATRKADIVTSDSAAGNASSTKSNGGSPSDNKNMVLTPPPDAQERVNQSRHRDTGEHANGQRRSSALTPPSSEQSTNAITAGGTAVSLRDLETLVDIDGMADDNLESFPAFSLDTTNMIMSPMNFQHTILPPASHPVHVRSNSGSSVQMNDFDHLINLEGGTDLFAPTKVDIDDNLFKDIDMEWLADPEPEPESATETEVQSEVDICSHHFDGTEQTDQRETPRSKDDSADMTATEADTTPLENKDTGDTVDTTNSGYAEVKDQLEEDQLIEAQLEKQLQSDVDKTFEGYAISGDLDLDLGIDDEFNEG